MMLGIHQSPGSFSDRWIQLCRDNSIPFEPLDCTSTDIMRQASGKSAILWHWTLHHPSEQLLARQVIAALEAKGLLVYPNSATCWHYDDKVGQKYLLESVDAPLATAWVFTDREQALDWISKTSWPKVFKLRCGASSANVWLVHSAQQARALVRRAFGSGFPAEPGYLHDVGTRLAKTKGWHELWGKLKRAPNTMATLVQLRRNLPRQRGYAYFQEFLSGNEFDTRVTVIGQRAFGLLRRNRPGDFRASGSGELVYDTSKVDLRCVQLAYDVARKLGTQSLAFDFLFDADHQPKIVEVSYCFVSAAVHQCSGYWDEALRWHPGHIWPEDMILNDVLSELGRHTLATNR